MANLANLSKQRRVWFRRRRKRTGDGFNYTEAMLLIDPATAARIGLTARSKAEPGLFDPTEHDPSR